jgi:hypothetical protein
LKSNKHTSSASDLLKLAITLYRDVTAKCAADVFDLRDLDTLRSRVEQEGISFLTITLPQFAKQFDIALDSGRIALNSFPGFRRVKDRGIPAFLQGILRHVFDQKTGELIDYDSPEFRGSRNALITSIEAIRQFCRFFSKVEIPCSDERVYQAFEKFKAIEQSLAEFSLKGSDVEDFLQTSDVLWHNLVAGISLSDLTPRHGPGATADRVSGNQKFRWRRWHERLDNFFPFFGNAVPLGAVDQWRDIEKVTFVPESAEQPVRVIQVPKTLTAPRIIAMEPVCMQFVQQGIRDVLYERIEYDYWLTRGHINFSDQSINQRFAMKSSIDQQLATIDLSDASDRVFAHLAIRMFNSNPDLRDAIWACRSTKAELPDGSIVGPLMKFASMGSALTFPVEAMYFYTICVVALLRERGLSCTPRNVFDVTRDVYVYGDDIIVPSTYAAAVCDTLAKYNCKVNTSKSFWNGKFRESCGVDAYDGEDVTPTYLRQLRPQSRRQASRLVSWVKTANLLYQRGYWSTAQLMFTECERVLGSLPYVSETSPGLGRVSLLGYRSAERWNDRLQCLEVRAYVPAVVHRDDGLDGYAALSKCLYGGLWESEDIVKPNMGTSVTSHNLPPISQTPSQRGSTEPGCKTELSTHHYSHLVKGVRKGPGCKMEVVRDKRHLERTALPGAIALKRRWVPAH